MLEERRTQPVLNPYEWTTEQSSSGKQPWHFHRHNEALMVFAGLWETWKGQGHEDPLQTFTIVTTEPNAFAARWHDRMPVVLPEARWDEWLDPGATREQLQALLVPYEGVDIEAWPVSPRMNTPRFESPECITKVSVPMPRP